LPPEDEVRHVTELIGQLQVPDYFYKTNKDGRDVIILEPKEKMVELVDDADAFTLTFAEPIRTSEQRKMAGRAHYARGAIGGHVAGSNGQRSYARGAL
jgi:hypothetical protein